MAVKKKKSKAKAKPLSLTVITDIGRLSYPQIAEPNPANAEINKNKYVCGLLIDENVWKDSAFAKKIKAAVVKVWADWSGETLEFKEINHPIVRMNSVKSREVASFEKDCIFLQAKSDAKYPPAIYGPLRDDDGELVELKESQVEKLKGGDYARLVIRVYAWAHSGNEGVSFGLDSVQFIRTGEAFGAGKAAAQKLLADNEIDPDEIEVDDVDVEDSDDDDDAPKAKKKAAKSTKKKKVEEEDEEEEEDFDGDEDADDEEIENSGEDDEDDSDDDSDDDEDEEDEEDEEEEEPVKKKGKSSSKSSKSKASPKSKKPAKRSSRKKDDDDEEFEV